MNQRKVFIGLVLIGIGFGLTAVLIVGGDMNFNTMFGNSNGFSHRGMMDGNHYDSHDNDHHYDDCTSYHGMIGMHYTDYNFEGCDEHYHEHLYEECDEHYHEHLYEECDEHNHEEYCNGTGIFPGY